MKNVLVFGANGFTGRAFVNELYQANGINIIRVVNRITTQTKKSDTFVADISSKDSVRTIFSFVIPDVVVNLAGVSSIGHASKNVHAAIGANLIGTQNILDCVVEICPHAKLLFVGSSEEYDCSEEKLSENSKLKPRNIYGFTKLWQEQLVGMLLILYTQ